MSTASSAPIRCLSEHCHPEEARGTIGIYRACVPRIGHRLFFIVLYIINIYRLISQFYFVISDKAFHNIIQVTHERQQCVSGTGCFSSFYILSIYISISFCFFLRSVVMIDFTHILQGCFTGTGAIARLPQCQWSNPEEYGHIHNENPLKHTQNKAQQPECISYGRRATKQAVAHHWLHYICIHAMGYSYEYIYIHYI